jgi:16S rRNA (cytosine967-C5)-methyltransferase
MEPDLLQLAARIIERSDKASPADAVLREELRAARLPGIDATQVSWAVFSYYRWLGWLEPRQALRQQIVAALELAERFAREPRGFPDDDLVCRAVPSWLKDHMPVTAAWVRTLQSKPPVWLRARPGQGRVLAAKLKDCRVLDITGLSDAVEYRGRNDLFRSAEFHAGEFELQDLNSQLVAMICGAMPVQTWWDACAGEGGKTLHLSDLMQNKGLIWSTDRAAWRLKILKRRAARAKVFNYRAALWNGESKLPTRTKFDGVLVDVPCSGIGTWQRNPHARWTTFPEDVRELAEVQGRLLTHASQAVKPGGRLVYAVCTMTRSETVAVVESFMNRTGDFEPMLISNPLDVDVRPAAQLELWPREYGGNGMFVAAWVRKSPKVPVG